MSTEKASTLTLRLTAEEAEALEQLKRITGKRTGSEAIKYIVKEYPRFVSNYKQQADKHRDVEQKYDRLAACNCLRIGDMSQSGPLFLRIG